MTITLTQAIQRVRFLIDDADANPLISDAEITSALEVAQEEVWQLVVDSGANLFYQTAALTSSSTGAVDLSGIKPLKIANVSWEQSGVTLQIPPARLFDGLLNVQQSWPISLVYVPRAVFPASPSAEFVWSQSSISMTTLDQLLCHVAASQVWIKTGEPPLASLEQRKVELQKSVENLINIPTWSVTPLGPVGSRNSGMYWRRSAHDTLQLVYC